MKKLSLISSFLLLVFSCSNQSFDRDLGNVSAFAEAVAAGAKPLALSSPMGTREMDEFFQLAKNEAGKYNVQAVREADFLTTDLFPESVTENKEVVELRGAEGLNYRIEEI